MLKYSPKSFAELTTPLSRNKIFLLVEITDPGRVDQFDYYHLVMDGLGLDSDPSSAIESALDRDYLVAETDITEHDKSRALAVVDFFRQVRLRDIVKVYLFIDEQLVEHSRDGLPSTYDLMTELPRLAYSLK